MRAQAVVFPRANEVSVGEVHLPTPRPGDVLIRTECSFVSAGTERWTLEAKMEWRGGGFEFPIVLGYQKVRRVVDTGAAVTRYCEEQRVFVTTGRIEDATACWGGHLRYAVQDAAEV